MVTLLVIPFLFNSTLWVLDPRHKTLEPILRALWPDREVVIRNWARGCSLDTAAQPSYNITALLLVIMVDWKLHASYQWWLRPAEPPLIHLILKRNRLLGRPIAEVVTGGDCVATSLDYSIHSSSACPSRIGAQEESVLISQHAALTLHKTTEVIPLRKRPRVTFVKYFVFWVWERSLVLEGAGSSSEHYAGIIAVVAVLMLLRCLVCGGIVVHLLI